MPARADFASAAAFLAASIVAFISDRPERTRSSASTEWATSAITPTCALSPAASISTPSFFASVTIVLVTVPTKVSLSWVSMVSAPVSVTFGAMAFFFSFT